jgi:hypothetical protein
VASSLQHHPAMPNPTASWDEVDEMLGHADSRIVQEIVETGASVDEIGLAIDELEAARGSGDAQMPASPRVAQIRKILEGMRRGLDEEGTMPIGGMLI